MQPRTDCRRLRVAEHKKDFASVALAGGRRPVQRDERQHSAHGWIAARAKTDHLKKDSRGDAAGIGKIYQGRFCHVADAGAGRLGAKTVKGISPRRKAKKRTAPARLLVKVHGASPRDSHPQAPSFSALAFLSAHNAGRAIAGHPKDCSFRADPWLDRKARPSRHPRTKLSGNLRESNSARGNYLS